MDVGRLRGVAMAFREFGTDNTMLLHEVADLVKIHPRYSCDEYVLDDFLVVEALRKLYPIAVEVIELVDPRIFGNASQELAKVLSITPYLAY